MEKQEKWFDIREAVKRGTALLLVGQPYAGKTTIVKSLITELQKIGVGDGDVYRGMQLPFPIIVHAPMSTLLEYKDVSYIHRMGVEPTVKRFDYYSTRYKNSLVIIEDMTRWLIGERRRQIADIFARRRKKSYNCLIISTVDSIRSVADFIDAFSHVLFFGRTHSITAIKSSFRPEICGAILNGLKEMRDIHDYIICDLRRDKVTNPINGDPIPLCYAFLDVLDKVAYAYERKVPISDEHDEILDKVPVLKPLKMQFARSKVDMIRLFCEESPWLSSRAIAKLVEEATGEPTTTNYVRKVRCLYRIPFVKEPEDKLLSAKEYVREFLREKWVV